MMSLGPRWVAPPRLREWCSLERRRTVPFHAQLAGFPDPGSAVADPSEQWVACFVRPPVPAPQPSIRDGGEP